MRPEGHGRRTAVVALGLAVMLAVAGCAGDGPGPAASSEPRTIVLTARHSRFEADDPTMARGQTVRFVVRNLDPIDHELIVGDRAVQDLHERGTEAHHGTVPGEVSVPAGAEAETTYTFAEAGSVILGCHLPGHWVYGMRTRIEVDG